MAVTNLLKQQVDQPVFEWMRPAPTATSSTSVLVSSDEKARYMYYLAGSQVMWRYDTYSDSWQECSAILVPTTTVAAKYAAYSGSRGHTISATSTTLKTGGFGKFGKQAIGNKIRIISGTGAGQERTITNVSDAVIHDNGVATTASANTIGDSTKKWRVNQWDGYSVRLTFASGQNQIRKILYNDTTTLTILDTNFQPIDVFNNAQFNTISPHAAPVTTAGSQTHFVIESCDITVNTAWDVTPDESSIYQIMTGGIWALTGSASTPFSLFWYYDILMDTWAIKTPLISHITTALGTDFAIDRTGEAGGVFVSGLTASSATAKTLVHSGATYDYDRYTNYQLRIVSGTGIGQRRRISAHTADTFYIDHKWDITPDNTSQYSIYGDTDKMWVVGNGSAAMYQYSVERDLWSSAPIVDGGIARQISATPAAGLSASYGSPHEGFGVTSITYTASGILTVAVNAAGTNYVVGDLVTCSTTGTNGQAYVTGVTSGGAVTSLQLAASGSGYSNGSSNTTGGSGSGLTITLTVGKVGNVVTATNHDFRHNEYVTIAGCATETTFNNTFQIIGVGSLTAFSIAANASATQSPTAASSLTTSLIVDATQNWTTNEHVGRLVFVQSDGAASPTFLGARRITANTATTLTLASAISAMTNGRSRYVIQEARPFGAMCIDKVAERSPDGWATSGTATTLVDTTKNWRINQYQNCRVRVVAGTGEGNDVVITANTATTLTVASWNVATPDATSKYEIMDSYGIVTTGAGTTTITDANKNFPVNYLAGKRVRYVAGTAVAQEASITSNTATVITMGTLTANATDTFYCVYEIPIRSTGTDIKWLFGISDTSKKGRWLISPRGGGSFVFDIFDIPTSRWEINQFIAPVAATLTTGSMYVYDGGDYYYFSKDATNRIYALDLSKFKVDIATSIPYAHGAATLGNKFEIVKTTDDLTYMYIMRHTGQEMWRTLKFW